MKVGWPEGRIPLAEATIYLATSPKSNSAYMAINNALELVRETGNLPVPAPAQRPYQADEAVGLRREVQVRSRLPRQLRQAAIPARRIERPPYLGATTQPCRAEAQGTDAATLGRGKEM